jgi:hypothetical protein
VTVEQLNPRLKGHGELYVHGRDKDGKVLMVFAVKKHIKGTEKMDDLKTFFIYMMERIERFVHIFFRFLLGLLLIYCLHCFSYILKHENTFTA